MVRVFLRAAAAILPLALAYPPASAQSPDVPIIRTTTSLVSIDVIVMDGDGHPVHNLPGSAFVVEEDGRRQMVTHFDEHQWKYAPQPSQPLPPGVFTNRRPAHDDTLNILVLDALNTPITAQMYAAQEIKRWVRNAPEGPEIAIVRLSTGLQLVQGFTTDKRMLLDAVSRTKAVQSSILGSDDFDGRFAYVKSRFRADYTEEAYKALAKFAAMYPGKKNILWFSGGGFPAPHSSLITEESDPGIYFDDAIQAGQQYLVNMSDVSVYVIGSRGLEANSAFDASHGGRPSLGSITEWEEVSLIRNMNLLQMGDRFGGRSFINTNDLAGAMQSSIELGSNYYTLAYRPSGHDLDGQEHQVRIRLQEGGYQLGYRRSYMAVVRDAATDNNPNGRPGSTPSKPETAMDLALGPGSPQLDGIGYEIRFTPIGQPNAVSPTLVADSTKDPKLKPGFHNFNLAFVADTAPLAATPLPDGRQHMSIEFLVTVYDARGFPKTSIAKTLRGDFTPQGIADLKRKGRLDFTLPISVPARGDMYVRTVVHDDVSGRTGTLEVPADMLHDLPTS